MLLTVTIILNTSVYYNNTSASSPEIKALFCYIL